MHHFFIIWFCTGVGTSILQTGVQPALLYTQVRHAHQPLSQQFHAAAELHFPPPVSPYHLPTQHHTQVSGYGHEFGSQPVYPLCSQQQEVTPQGNF